jgi:hypothetical protein
LPYILQEYGDFNEIFIHKFLKISNQYNWL